MRRSSRKFHLPFTYSDAETQTLVEHITRGLTDRGWLNIQATEQDPEARSQSRMRGMEDVRAYIDSTTVYKLVQSDAAISVLSFGDRAQYIREATELDRLLERCQVGLTESSGSESLLNQQSDVQALGPPVYCFKGSKSLDGTTWRDLDQDFNLELARLETEGRDLIAQAQAHCMTHPAVSRFMARREPEAV